MGANVVLNKYTRVYHRLLMENSSFLGNDLAHVRTLVFPWHLQKWKSLQLPREAALLSQFATQIACL